MRCGEWTETSIIRPTTLQPQPTTTNPFAVDELPVFLGSGFRRRFLVRYDCAHGASSFLGLSVASASGGKAT